ncbi:MAG: hypothetical protein FRX49_10625 [Trebouxia sp. A1-2]|nr:MAG: hypothetical protein FRX49_10625 [Trebouxia sp. A1-2]
MSAGAVTAVYLIHVQPPADLERAAGLLPGWLHPEPQPLPQATSPSPLPWSPLACLGTHPSQRTRLGPWVLTGLVLVARASPVDKEGLTVQELQASLKQAQSKVLWQLCWKLRPAWQQRVGLLQNAPKQQPFQVISTQDNAQQLRRQVWDKKGFDIQPCSCHTYGSGEGLKLCQPLDGGFRLVQCWPWECVCAESKKKKDRGYRKRGNMQGGHMWQYLKLRPGQGPGPAADWPALGPHLLPGLLLKQALTAALNGMPGSHCYYLHIILGKFEQYKRPVAATMHGATRGGGLTGGGRQAFLWAEGGLVLAPMGDVPQAHALLLHFRVVGQQAQGHLPQPYLLRLQASSGIKEAQPLKDVRTPRQVTLCVLTNQPSQQLMTQLGMYGSTHQLGNPIQPGDAEKMHSMHAKSDGGANLVSHLEDWQQWKADGSKYPGDGSGMQHDWVLARCSVAQAAVGYPIESARAAMGSPSAQSASRLCSADSAQLSKPDTCTSRLLDALRFPVVLMSVNSAIGEV